MREEGWRPRKNQLSTVLEVLVTPVRTGGELAKMSRRGEGGRGGIGMAAQRIR